MTSGDPRADRRAHSDARPGGFELAYVALGSNLGEREAHLRRALASLREAPGIACVRCSPIYETDPIGPAPQEPYLNAVVELLTELPPRPLLERLQAIEAAAGRVRRAERNLPRTLDLDLLLYADRCVDEPGLEVPHPRLHERAFVLTPLCDLAPRLVHPRLAVRLEELLERVRDEEAVRPWRPA